MLAGTPPSHSLPPCRARPSFCLSFAIVLKGSRLRRATIGTAEYLGSSYTVISKPYRVRRACYTCVRRRSPAFLCTHLGQVSPCPETRPNFRPGRPDPLVHVRPSNCCANSRRSATRRLFLWSCTPCKT